LTLQKDNTKTRGIDSIKRTMIKRQKNLGIQTFCHTVLTPLKTQKKRTRGKTTQRYTYEIQRPNDNE